jgi:hypothetical protein
MEMLSATASLSVTVVTIGWLELLPPTNLLKLSIDLLSQATISIALFNFQNLT